MADAVDLTSEYTTLHQDLVAENGLIKQLLAGFATGVLTQAQAATLLEGMTADDADAKSNVAAITAALTPATSTGTTTVPVTTDGPVTGGTGTTPTV